MAEECIEFLSAVIVVSRNPARLAEFYRDVVGLPLVDEHHGDSLPHYGCTLGDLHFAIHPVESFPDRRDGVGSVKLAFNVFDLQAFAQRLTAKGVKLLYPPKDTGFFISTAINDPDGNLLEFTQLVDQWFTQLEERKSRGLDVVSRWKAARGRTTVA
jgi:catechol 2,3-dioxygenase-like lactoylglutathione lyase family enzyme